MAIDKEMLITKKDIKVGDVMSYITFGELIQEMTGLSFEEIYKDNLIQGEIKDAESKLE